MTDNVTELPRSKKLMPVGWREHRDRLRQTEGEIAKLRHRLEKQHADLRAVALRDIEAEGDASERKSMTSAMEYFAKNARDAVALLECAEERLGYATPDDWCFEYGM